MNIKINGEDIAIYPDVSESIFYKLMSLLVYNNIQMNRERTNSGAGRSQCYGIVHKRGLPDGISRNNVSQPHIWEELQNIAKHLPVPDGWTSVQLNQDYVCMRHYDSGNIGSSCIVSFGCYEGGELVIEENQFNTRLKPIVANFTKLEHFVKPLNGTKFSLVYFKCADRKEVKVSIKKTKKKTADDYKKYYDESKMFNVLPAVEHLGKERLWPDVEIVNNAWWSGAVRIPKRAKDKTA